jgi:hypothetical protein
MPEVGLFGVFAELLLVFSDDEAARRFRTGVSWAA